MTPLSAYILTFNSEPHLAEILGKLAGTADELLVVDSGSTDRTLTIAREHGCRVVHRPFTDFREQRSFAQAECVHDMVLFVDSDELPSDELVEAIASLKARGFGEDAYEVRREWYAFGRKVSAVYPVVSPDYPIRILDRRKVSFDERSRRVHETPFGHSSLGRIEAALHHHTFGSTEELERKLAHYTDIAAAELCERGANGGPMKELANPPVAFLLWYFLKGGWRDGALGLRMSRYAFRYTRLKYRKARLFSEARGGGS
ncbi:MAG: glycosyltransferase family 2 protein [Holophagales bacterium]|nr:glycosyltransferase family 2 protein [Holophagales bacterium]